jgi:hypothetical protein
MTIAPVGRTMFFINTGNGHDENHRNFEIHYVPSCQNFPLIPTDTRNIKIFLV